MRTYSIILACLFGVLISSNSALCQWSLLVGYNSNRDLSYSNQYSNFADVTSGFCFGIQKQFKLSRALSLSASVMKHDYEYHTEDWNGYDYVAGSLTYLDIPITLNVKLFPWLKSLGGIQYATLIAEGQDDEKIFARTRFSTVLGLQGSPFGYRSARIFRPFSFQLKYLCNLGGRDFGINNSSLQLLTCIRVLGRGNRNRGSRKEFDPTPSPIVNEQLSDTDFVPFTVELKQRAAEHNIDLKRVQFYISETVKMERIVSAEEKGNVHGGVLLFENGQYRHIVNVRKYTPGVCVNYNDKAIVVNFEEEVPDNVIEFQENSPYYTLAGTNWKSNSVDVVYDRQTYNVSCVTCYNVSGVKLMVRKHEAANFERTERTVNGRRIKD